MPNSKYISIFKNEVQKFVNEFEHVSRDVFTNQENGRLIHSGEFGEMREKICKGFLELITPRRLTITHSGFIITPNDRVSTQMDLIIFDKSNTPLIRDDNHYFYPVDTVAGIGEIKSVLSFGDFKNALIKLSKQKEMRFDLDGMVLGRLNNYGLHPQYQVTECFDQIFSFLICEKFNFDPEKVDFDKMYAEVPVMSRHNLILSLRDGIFIYKSPGGVQNAWPERDGLKHENFFEKAMSEKIFHFMSFSQHFNLGVDRSSIFSPELLTYLDFDWIFSK